MAKTKESSNIATATSSGTDGRLWVVYLQLATAMAFFGMSFVFTSLALQELRPISIIFFRLVVSLMALLLFSRIPAVVRIVGRPRIPRPEHRRIFACVALFQPFMYFLAENTGLLYASPAVAAIIIATIPIVTPVATFLLMAERLTARVAIGALASFGGVALIVLAGGEAGGADPLGVLLIFGAVLAAVGYAIAVRNVPREYGAFTLVVWQNLIGVCLFLPLLLIFDVPQLLDSGLPSVEILGAIAFLGVFPSTLSFIFLGRGIRILGPTKANLMANTVPIFAVVFSVAVLGETIRGITLVGMVIVIAGVLLGQVRRERLRPVVVVEPADLLVAKRGCQTNGEGNG